MSKHLFCVRLGHVVKSDNVVTFLLEIQSPYETVDFKQKLEKNKIDKFWHLKIVHIS